MSAGPPGRVGPSDPVRPEGRTPPSTGPGAGEGGGPGPGFSSEVPDTVDVVVVGGGIAGCAAACHLARAGVSVAVLERDTVGGGATSAAAGILSPPVRQPFHETVRFRGEEVARQVWRFALRSVEGLADLLEARSESRAAELDLRGGNVLAEPWTEHLVRGSYDALARAGLPVRWLASEEVRTLTGGGRGFTGGYRLEGGGALDPPGTARALARAARAGGALVVEATRVKRVRTADNGFRVETGRGEVEALAVVYAAHVESVTLVEGLGSLVSPIRGQAFSTEPLHRRFAGSFSTDWKLNVWRQTPEGRLVVSGWRHDAWNRSWGRPPAVDRYLQGDLRAWFETAFPDLAPLPVEREWSGQFGWTPDYLPLVGAIPGRSGEWVIAGFSGGGLPFAFEAGRALAHALAGGEAVPGAHLLDPARFAR